MAGSFVVQGARSTQITPYTAGTRGAHSPEIAALDTGGYAMTWYDDLANGGNGDTVFLQLADANGALIGSPITVNGGGTAAGEVRSNPSIAVTENGNIIVSWRDETPATSQIAYRMFDASGNALTGVQTANATAGVTGTAFYSEPDVEALATGGFVLNWSQNVANAGNFDGALVGRFFDNAGTATTGEVILQSATDPIGAEFQTATVTELANGSLVWTWETGFGGRDIRSLITDAAGAITTPTFDPRELTAQSVGFFSVEPLGNGNFMVVMTYNSMVTASGGNGNALVVARIFEPDGTPVTGDFGLTGSPNVDRFPLHTSQDGEGGILVTFGQQSLDSDVGPVETNAMLVHVAQDGSALGEPTWLETRDFPMLQGAGAPITLLSSGDFAFVTPDGSDGGTLFHGKLFNGADLRFSDNSDSVTLSAGGDIVSALEGDDTVNGGASADFVSGGLGADRLFGNGGDDVLNGQSGADSVDGNGGNDLLRGDRGDDTVNGGADNDLIDGGTGSDELNGGTGHDTIIAGLGSDTVNGGTGDDDIQGFRDITLNHGPFDGTRDTFLTNVLNGEAGNDTIAGGEGSDIIDGGSDDDSLDGKSGDDIISGGSGRDTLIGGNGDDTLVLNDGDALFGSEVFNGQGGHDTLLVTGGAGAVGHGLSNQDIRGIEVLQYGAIAAGGDRTFFLSSRQLDPGIANDLQEVIGLDVAGSTEVLHITGDFANLRNVDLSGIIFTDWGGQGERVEFYEDTGSASIIGTSQLDHLFGQAGDDTLEGGASGDLIDGGDDNDTASYLSSAMAVEISLALGTATGGDATGDTLIGIENLLGSVHNDLLTGNSAANRLEGVAGRDTLDGAGGNDTLIGTDDFNNIQGRSGDDEIMGNGGADILAGGAGFDLLQWGDDGVTARGDGDNDTLIGGAGADDVSAGTGNDSVDAGGGNDTLRGQGNDDTLNGEDGADQIFGGSGSDLISGGADADDLLGQGNGDTLMGDAGNDTLSGAAGADSLMGGADDDRLLGGNAADTLDGGTGNDTLIGGTGADDFIFGLGYGEDRVNGFLQAIDQLFLDDALWEGTPGINFVPDLLTAFGSLNTNGTIYTLDFGNGDRVELQNGTGIVLATLADSIEVF